MKFLDKIKEFFVNKRIEELSSELEYKNRKNLELLAKNDILEKTYESLFSSTKKFFDSREKKEHKSWKLIDSNGEHWIRSDLVSYVGPTVNNAFVIVIDCCSQTLEFLNEDEAKSAKESILNVGYIPTEESYDDIKKFKGEEERETLGRVFSKKKPKIEEKATSVSRSTNLEKLNAEIKNKKK